ncbi:hypothetical protein GIB67_013458 [Kingdonia uniflora]|uniref:WEB family protein n=1 Tax=Kingdonia uniflora TaxID=39325 RepID=A0A7J7LR62_9MAGN|nr:hypothetical protein GIB67_013458 [Kingdonia uniflora]
MGIKARRNSTDSSKAEVGEIDTRSPFESVKAAVSLFGESAFSGSGEKTVIRKSKPIPAERVLAKETKLHLAQKELNKFKDNLKNAETTKIQALSELEKAKRTVEDLNNKLRTVIESKESAIKATESAKGHSEQLEESTSSDPIWKNELDIAREQYTSAISELNAAKHELRKAQQDFEASLEAKVSAFQQAAEAENLTMVNTERIGEISKEISASEESLMEMKLASVKSHQDKSQILSEKDVQRQSYRTALQEAEKKIASFKSEFDPNLTTELEAKLAETTSEIGVLQKEMENSRASDLDSVKIVTLELDDAKEALHKVADEESSLRSLMESLKLELETVKKEHTELKEKEAETETIAGNLHVKLRKCKTELESAIGEESKVRGASDELIATLVQLSSESENARLEAEEMKKKAEELKTEATAIRTALEEAEKKLQVALKEAEDAKNAETKALELVRVISEKTNAGRTSLTSESDTKITISTEEFESLKRKLEESDVLAEMKVAAAVAQVEAVKASENEAQKKLERSLEEIEEMKSLTEDALKRAEMAGAAKKAVEGELRRWRERDQKRAAETASRILAEAEKSTESSPRHATIFPKQVPLEKASGTRKLEKPSGSKKALLPNLSGIFLKKKNQVEGGSPSYLPGEKPI